MKRTLLIAAAILGTASAAMAQDVARPQAPQQEKASQDAPPMRTRSSVQRQRVQVAPATAAMETSAAKPQPAAQPSPVNTVANEVLPMRTRRTLSPAPAVAPNR